MTRVMVMGGFSESLINFRGAMLKRMVELGHDVIACAPGATTEEKEELARLGVSYRHIPLNRRSMNPLRDFWSLLMMVVTMRQTRPDALLCYTIKPVLYGAFAARLAGVPKIYLMITGLGQAFDSRNPVIGAIARNLYRISTGIAERVFFQNPDDQHEFVISGILREPAKAVRIYGSGVDVDYFQPAPFPHKMTFLLMARLMKSKGIELYAEAAKLIKQTHDVRFCLAGWFDGKGPEMISPDQVNSWQREGIIEYLGRLRDVRPAIADSTTYIFPVSFREGTPRSVLEAMAMGRPLIVTDVPGARETVDSGQNGFIVAPGDLHALVAAITNFIRNPGLIYPMGQKSREMAVALYDVKKVNEVIMSTMELNHEAPR